MPRQSQDRIDKFLHSRAASQGELTAQHIIIKENNPGAAHGEFPQFLRWAKLVIFGLMASIIPGFEYDIFISYRHKDNKGDHWVTDFVQALKTELESTFKEDISIYFDTNPHDGLLETHDVDKSLEGKLTCLIFIPIISQTYCDTRSFAWQHEFCAFNKRSKEDPFGRDIKLGNGNVTSRILPVKIHDLDDEDKKTIETEIGGVLRAIEFIYKEAGVNRPLKATDSRSDNQNKTDYRNQVNKVANAIKEIIVAIKNPVSSVPGTRNRELTTSPVSKRKYAVTGLFALLLLVAASFLYLKFKSPQATDGIDKSIAVLPFADMSPAHDQEYFGDGVSEEIINVLAQSEGLKVIARSSSFQFKGKNEDLKKVGEMLGVANILEGSIRKSSDQIRITAQLIKVIDGTHLWSKTFDRSPKDVFAVQDEIAQAVASALKTTLMEGATTSRQADWNEEAKKEYQLGRYYFDRRGDGDFELAQVHFKRSIALDSSSATAYAYTFVNCINLLGGYGASEGDCYPYLERGLQLDPTQPDVVIYNATRYLFHYDFVKAEEEMNKALRYGPKNPTVLRNAGRIKLVLGSPAEAIRLGEESVAADPLQTFALTNLARSYACVGRYDDAIRLTKKAREISKSKNDGLTVFYLLNDQVQEAIRENDETSGELHNFLEILIQFKLQHAGQAASLLKTYVKSNGSEFFPWRCALAAAYTGDKELAFEWLEKCYQQKHFSLVNIRNEPLLVTLRNDPRFMDLVRRMNFPENR